MKNRPERVFRDEGYVPEDMAILENELLNRTLTEGYEAPSIPEVGMRSVLDALNGTEEIEELHRRGEVYDPTDLLRGNPYFGLY